MSGSPNNNHHSSSPNHTPSLSFSDILLLTLYSFTTFKRKGLILSLVSHLIECQAIQLYQPHHIN